MDSTGRHTPHSAGGPADKPISAAGSDSEPPLSAVGLAAVSYVSQWQWPLMVGANFPAGHGRRGLGLDDGVLEATTDPVRVREWWRRWPGAGIVARTGDCFDIVTVPATAGRHLLDRLTAQGAWLGPVMADDDVVALLVAPGQGSRWTDLIAASGDGHSHRGRGQLILLPPNGPNSGGLLRWVVPPTAANVPHLPWFDDLGGLITAATHLHEGRR